MRPLLLAILLLSPLVAGCFGGSSGDAVGPRLAQPTDKPPSIPVSTTAPRPAVDLTDPGYVMTGRWTVGDGWDYESNQSRYRTVRVIGESQENGTRFYLVEETNGVIGNRPQTRIRMLVDGDNWSRVNYSYVGGALNVTFTPPANDLRFLRNGTIQYNQTETILTAVTKSVARVNFHYVGPERIHLDYGDILAGRVEARLVRVTGDTTTREFTVRHVYREFLNDLQYQTHTGEVFQLAAARVGPRTLSVLQPT